VHDHGFFATLVESCDSKVGPSFKVGVFCFCIVFMDCVVVESPGIVYVFPQGSDGTRCPRSSVALMRPLGGFAEVSILEECPFFRPITLKEFMPPNGCLGGDCASTPSRVVGCGDGGSSEPCGNGFEYHSHKFIIGLGRFQISSEVAQRSGPPLSLMATCTSKKVWLIVKLVATRTMWGVISIN
jgi:hypothetical protein